MNAIASAREEKEALQRAATGQELTHAQAALVNEYKALEQQHNAQAKPAYSGEALAPEDPTTSHRSSIELGHPGPARKSACNPG